MKEQHTKPCSDCPWRRKAIPGWLGMSDETPEEIAKPQEWLDRAHGEVVIECHTHLGCQCAGVSIYRANMSKVPRYSEILQLPKDKANVFSTSQEFIDHHTHKACPTE